MFRFKLSPLITPLLSPCTRQKDVCSCGIITTSYSGRRWLGLSTSPSQVTPRSLRMRIFLTTCSFCRDPKGGFRRPHKLKGPRYRPILTTGGKVKGLLVSTLRLCFIIIVSRRPTGPNFINKNFRSTYFKTKHKGVLMVTFDTRDLLF